MASLNGNESTSAKHSGQAVIFAKRRFSLSAKVAFRARQSFFHRAIVMSERTSKPLTRMCVGEGPENAASVFLLTEYAGLETACGESVRCGGDQ
jgi:hypothetical protein